VGFSEIPIEGIDDRRAASSIHDVHRAPIGPRSMRACFVSREVAGVRGGGIGTYVVEAAAALRGRGHEVWLVTEDPGLDRAQGAALAGLTAFDRTLTVRGTGGPALFHARKHYGYALRVQEVLQKVELPFDYVEFPDYHAEGLVAIREQRLFRTYGDAVLTVTLHTPSRECYAFNEQLHRAGEEELELFELEDDTIRHAPFLHCPSAALRDLVADRLSIDRDVIALVPYPLRPLTPAPLEPRSSIEQLRFLHFGRVEPRKGLRCLCSAFARLPECSIRVVGEDTPLSPYGTSYRASLERSCPSNVRFADPLPRELLLRDLAQSDVCVFPALFDNWPNACLEAMSVGRIVVASRSGGMAEMIEDGVSGFLFDAGDPDDLVDAIRERLARRLPDLPEIGAAAVERARQIASPAVYADRIERLVRARRTATKPVPTAAGSSSAATRSPRVSIVIPFFNDAETVGEAVDSAVQQEHPNLEILIVNDGSPLPDAEAILQRQAAKDDRVRLLQKRNGGLGSARNFGIDHATGEYVAFLDADNLLRPAYASTAVVALASDPSLGFVVPHARFFESETKREVGIYNPLPYSRAFGLVMNRFGDAGACFRRSVFADRGLSYDELLISFEDWALWLDLDAAGIRGTGIPRILYDYRVRDRSMVARDGWTNLNALVGLLISRHFPLRDERMRDVLRVLQQTWGHVAHTQHLQDRAQEDREREIDRLRLQLDASYSDHAGTLQHRDALLRECELLRERLRAAEEAARGFPASPEQVPQ
jgi:glycosyltransferase involved in cell wall biosynthesis